MNEVSPHHFPTNTYPSLGLSSEFRPLQMEQYRRWCYDKMGTTGLWTGECVEASSENSPEVPKFRGQSFAATFTFVRIQKGTMSVKSKIRIWRIRVIRRKHHAFLDIDVLRIFDVRTNPVGSWEIQHTRRILCITGIVAAICVVAVDTCFPFSRS